MAQTGIELIAALWLVAALAASLGASEKGDGYRGILYHHGGKYKGGLGTFPNAIHPFAVHREEVDRTFFCWGGVPGAENTLYSMVSFYDHATCRVPRPTIVVKRGTRDAHDNPCLALDAEGHIWVFSPPHGNSQSAGIYIHRSTKPYAIDDFEEVPRTNCDWFAYPQPHVIPGRGILLLHTKYEKELGRTLAMMTSPDGLRFGQRRWIAKYTGHYSVSRQSRADPHRIGWFFNEHAYGGIANRTNLYYIETRDFGRAWQNVRGETLELPLSAPLNPALVRNYWAEGRQKTWPMDLDFDRLGRPVLLYLTAPGERGSRPGSRPWLVAHWTGDEWAVRRITASDDSYDHGCLYAETDGTWRVIGPTGPGSSEDTGGEVVMWTSTDEGRSWSSRSLTPDPEGNHSYVRNVVGAHPDFTAFWADADRAAERSRLYFASKDGRVWRLPYEMQGEWARPELIRRVAGDGSLPRRNPGDQP